MAQLPSEDRWHAIRNALAQHLRRSSAHCFHYVVEWQARGVPHIHGLAFYRSVTGREGVQLLAMWLGQTRELGASERGQHVAEVFDVAGWIEYCAKHAARGANNYQRDAAAVPASWSKTGRMWFRGGDWPVRETDVELTLAQFHLVRRILQAWQRAAFRTKRKRTTGWRSDYWRRSETWARNRRVRLVERRANSERGFADFVPESVMLRAVDLARELRPDGRTISVERSDHHAKFTWPGFSVVVAPADGLQLPGARSDGNCPDRV